MTAYSIYLVQAFALLEQREELEMGKDEVLSPLSKFVFFVVVIFLFYFVSLCLLFLLLGVLFLNSPFLDAWERPLFIEIAFN